MKAMTTVTKLGRRGLVLSALAGSIFAALLAFGADQAQASYTARVEANTLTLTGNSDSDRLVLRLQPGSPTTLDVDVGADGTADFSFDRTTFTAIDVQARGGDDEVRVDQVNGAFTDEQITMDGGAGADTLLGGSGAETMIGGSGDDLVDGNQGQDLALLGAGVDRFQWDPGDASDVVEGQGGKDAMDFNGANIGENIDVSANGGRVRFFRNIANITIDLDDVEAINFRALGGADNVVVNDTAGTDLQTVDVNLAASLGGGDGQPDNVTANGTAGPDSFAIGSAGSEILVSGLAAALQVSDSEEANDNVNVATLGGEDTITMGVGATSGPAPINFDGGDEQDVATYSGTPGADSIGVVANGSEASVESPGTARFDVIAESLVVLGLGGPDTITGSGNLAPLTALTLDGGADGDTLLGGNGADRLLGGSGDDFVDGNQGQDLALLGAGVDTFQWDPGDASDVVEGQAGKDVLDFNGANIAENIDVSANGGRVRFTRNIANITMDIDDVERINYRALGGADNVVVNDTAGTDLQTVDVDLAASIGGGDGEPDNVTASGTAGADHFTVGSAGSEVLVSGLSADVQVANGEEANDNVNAAGLGGEDTIAMGVGATSGPAPINFDGGNDLDVATYSGTPGADSIGVVANGSEASVESSGTARFDVIAESLVVLGLGGPDTITGSGNLAPLTALTLDGGADGDTLLGGNGADRLLGGGGDDLVDGNQGQDLALLGAGVDRFQWDPGDASDVVEGQGGKDAMDFNGANIGENIDVSANGGRVRFFRNIANITIDLDDVEAINFRALGGADNVVVNDTAGTDLQTVDVNLAASLGGGDGQPDNVTANGTAGPDSFAIGSAGSEILVSGLAAALQVSDSEEANDNVNVATLGGEDTIAMGVGATSGPAPINFDGGNDLDVATYSGTPGADSIGVVANGSEASVESPGTARFDVIAESLVVLGLGGPDTITGSGNLAPLTALTLDGGADGDTLLGGNGADRLLGGGGDDLVDGNQGQDLALLGQETTPSSGIRVTEATSSRARPARTRSTSTGATCPRSWTSPRMAVACASRATSRP